MSEAVNPSPETSTETGPAPDPSPRPDPVRLTSVFGSLAAVCLCVAYFLPWIEVDERLAADFHATVTREIERRDERSEGAEQFLDVAETLVAERALRGTDFIHWLRAGQSFSRDLDEEVNPGVSADDHLRRLELVKFLLYGLPLAAFLLAAHFLMHRFRRARAPVLILAILTGLGSVVTAAVLDLTQAFIAPALKDGAAHLGLGWYVLLWGGIGLGLAGVFGVRPRNWFRVYVISAAMAAALGVLGLRYLQTGGLL